MIDKELLNLLEKDKIKIVYITLIKILNLLLQVVAIGVICYVLEETINNSNYYSLYWLILSFSLIVIKFIFNYISGKIEANIGNSIQKELRIKFFNKIINHKGIIKGYNSQALSNLGLEGIEQLNLYYVTYIPQFFYSLISPLILFIIFCFIDYQIALVFLISVPLIPLSIILISKYAKKIFNKYWDKYLSMGGDFLDNLKGIKELKLFKYDQIAQDKMDQNSEEFRKITMKVLVMQLWSTSIMDFVAFGGAAIGMSVAILNLINGIIPSPYALLFIIIVGAEFFLPMRALGSAFHISMNGQTAGKKILKILNTIDEFDGDIEIKEINNIKISNLGLSYDENVVLNNFSLDIKENGLYSIIGNSGSGKSTLVKALNKSLKPFKGEILINDINLNDIKSESFYERVAFISYENHIFMKSIYDNFKLINKDATIEDMKEALKIVKLDHFNDLNFQFKENASNVSGGEKQRFVLAFYLTKKYDFYVFDEATSNIDVESEEIIMSFIKKLAKDSKILMISHRLKNTINSNNISLLENGEVIESENYNSLINRDSKFKKLLNLQISMEEGLNYENNI